MRLSTIDVCMEILQLHWCVCVWESVAGGQAWHARVYACVWAKKSTVYTRQKSHLHACEAIAAQNVPKAFNVSIISWVSSYILLNPYIASLNISILSIDNSRCWR